MPFILLQHSSNSVSPYVYFSRALKEEWKKIHSLKNIYIAKRKTKNREKHFERKSMKSRSKKFHKDPLSTRKDVSPMLTYAVKSRKKRKSSIQNVVEFGLFFFSCKETRNEMNISVEMSTTRRGKCFFYHFHSSFPVGEIHLSNFSPFSQFTQHCMCRHTIALDSAE